jgi:hypothetical protein
VDAVAMGRAGVRRGGVLCRLRGAFVGDGVFSGGGRWPSLAVGKPAVAGPRLPACRKLLFFCGGMLLFEPQMTLFALELFHSGGGMLYFIEAVLHSGRERSSFNLAMLHSDCERSSLARVMLHSGRGMLYLAGGMLHSAHEHLLLGAVMLHLGAEKGRVGVA